MKRLFWVGMFDTSCNNIGDHAQILATQKLIDEQFKDYRLVTYARSQIGAFLKQKLAPDDLIFIASSGDFGDLYSNTYRKKIIEAHPDNKIVQLPVSVHYRYTSNFETDKTFYGNRPNLLIMCRQPDDAELLQNNFGCKVIYYPDLALSLKPQKLAPKRKDILAVFRTDSESMFHLVSGRSKLKRAGCRIFNKIKRYHNRKWLYKSFKNCIHSDIELSKTKITDANREQTVNQFFFQVSKYKLVLTDRFHTCVAAYLTSTPYIAFEGTIKNKTNIYPLDYKQYFTNFRNIIFSELQHIEPERQPDNNILDCIRARRSVRSWNNKQVEPYKLELVLEAGVYAPSACNLQATRLKPLTAASDIQFACQHTSIWFRASNSQAAILVYYDKTNLMRGWHQKFMWQDTSCAMQNMMLAAESLGLSSCWATVDKKQAKQLNRRFRTDKNHELTCMLLLGYSNHKPTQKSMHQGRKIERSLKASLT